MIATINTEATANSTNTMIFQRNATKKKNNRYDDYQVNK